MTTIKAVCPKCGDVDLTPAEVKVTTAQELGWSTYTFSCVICKKTVVKPGDDDIVQLLSGAGVVVVNIDVPPEYLQSRVIEGTNRPLTIDDILDFMLWLRATEDIVTPADKLNE